MYFDLNTFPILQQEKAKTNNHFTVLWCRIVDLSTDSLVRLVTSPCMLQMMLPV